ncbi:MAG: hypothetical protein AAF706_02840, partial [Bacteroidota bacterium]
MKPRNRNRRGVAFVLLVSMFLQSCGVDVPIREQEVDAQARPTLEVYASCPTNDISRYIELKTHCAPCEDLKPSQLEIMPPPAQPTISQPSTKPSTCGVCQEIVSYTFTSQQGYPVHFAYHRGIWEAVVIERLGSFSRSEILPVVCENNGDIGQFLSGLKSKSSNYVQRHIHVAHSQQITDPVSFVYLGKQGLRGGADDHSQTSEKKEIKSVKTLVEALNTAKPEEQAKLAELVKECIAWFNRSEIANLTLGPEILQEYVNLAHIQDSSVNRQLLENYFRSLADKVSMIRGKKHMLMQALKYSLRSMKSDIFRNGFKHDDVFDRLANDLLSKLDTQSVNFSQRNYSAYQSTLYTLCETLLLISELDQWKQDQLGGIYEKFEQWFERIKTVQHYYPFKYDAQLLREILKHLQIPKSLTEGVSERAISGLKAL